MVSIIVSVLAQFSSTLPTTLSQKDTSRKDTSYGCLIMELDSTVKHSTCWSVEALELSEFRSLGVLGSLGEFWGVLRSFFEFWDYGVMGLGVHAT